MSKKRITRRRKRAKRQAKKRRSNRKRTAGPLVSPDSANGGNTGSVSQQPGAQAESVTTLDQPAQTSESEDPPIIFQRGDQAEIAARLIQDLKATLPDNAPLVYDRGRFWRYREGIYQPIQESKLSAAIQRYSGAVVADSKKGLRVSRSLVKGTISLAADLLEHNTPPGFFDDAPPHVAFKNTVLVVEKQRIVEKAHSPDSRATWTLPFKYLRNAPARRFRRYLHEIFEPDEDRVAKAALLQEIVGVLLFGLTTHFQVAFLLFGDGENGKSVLIDIILSLFPEEAQCAIPPQRFASEYYAAQLAGKRINAVSETPEREILQSEILKSLITGDPITARFAYGKPFTYRPEAGHVFAANVLPQVSDTTPAFWRRWIMVEFNRKFPKGDPACELDLARKIVSPDYYNELPAIAAFAVEGAHRVLERGHLAIPECSQGALNKWRVESNPVALFVKECTRPLASTDGETWPTAQEIYQVYRPWCKKNGFSVLNKTAFGRRLSILAPKKKSSSNRYALWLLKRGSDGQSLSDARRDRDGD